MGCSHRLWLAGNRQEKFELGWELVLGVQSVGEIDSTNAAVCMNLNSKRLDVVGTVSSAREIRQVELDLVPAFIEAHGHCADERLHTRRRLIVRSAEPTTHVLVIENLYLEREVFLQVLDNHNKEGQFDGKCFLRLDRARDVIRRHVGAHDLEHRGLNVCISQSLDVAVPHILVPDLQWLRSD